jgi:hypothetical protein
MLHSLPFALQVIDLISLKPFDMETISKSIKKTRKALIVEECMKTGGIGASLSAVINESLFDELDHQVCTGIACVLPAYISAFEPSSGIFAYDPSAYKPVMYTCRAVDGHASVWVLTSYKRCCCVCPLCNHVAGFL